MKLNLSASYARAIVSVVLLIAELIIIAFYTIPQLSTAFDNFDEARSIHLDLYFRILAVLFLIQYLVIALCVDKYSNNRRLRIFAICCDIVLMLILFLRLFRILPIV